MSLEDGMLDSPLESPIGSPSPEDRHKCQSCHDKMKQPVVLSCLHVFCLTCLEKQVCLLLVIIFVKLRPGKIVMFMVMKQAIKRIWKEDSWSSNPMFVGRLTVNKTFVSSLNNILCIRRFSSQNIWTYQKSRSPASQLIVDNPVWTKFAMCLTICKRLVAWWRNREYGNW